MFEMLELGGSGVKTEEYFRRRQSDDEEAEGAEQQKTTKKVRPRFGRIDFAFTTPGCRVGVEVNEFAHMGSGYAINNEYDRLVDEMNYLRKSSKDGDKVVLIQSDPDSLFQGMLETSASNRVSCLSGNFNLLLEVTDEIAKPDRSADNTAFQASLGENAVVFVNYQSSAKQRWIQHFKILKDKPPFNVVWWPPNQESASTQSLSLQGSPIRCEKLQCAFYVNLTRIHYSDAFFLLPFQIRHVSRRTPPRVEPCYRF